MKLEPAGAANNLWITAQIIARDDSTGRPQLLKIWEKTGDVGMLSDQSLARGVVPANLSNEIRRFFAALRVELIRAREP